MFRLIILNTVKIRANAFPFSSSSVGFQGICNCAVRFSHTLQTRMPHAVGDNWKAETENSISHKADIFLWLSDILVFNYEVSKLNKLKKMNWPQLCITIVFLLEVLSIFLVTVSQISEFIAYICHVLHCKLNTCLDFGLTQNSI